MKSTPIVFTSIMSLALAAPVAHNEHNVSIGMGLPIDLSLQRRNDYSDSENSWYITVQWYCFQDAVVLMLFSYTIVLQH
jgi:hypothetical protein